MLDTSHLREYTDLGAFRSLVTSSGLRVIALELRLLWFPLLDPLLFRVGGSLATHPRMLGVIRAAKVPILGYHSLEFVLER